MICIRHRTPCNKLYWSKLVSMRSENIFFMGCKYRLGLITVTSHKRLKSRSKNHQMFLVVQQFVQANNKCLHCDYKWQIMLNTLAHHDVTTLISKSFRTKGRQHCLENAVYSTNQGFIVFVFVGLLYRQVISNPFHRDKRIHCSVPLMVVVYFSFHELFRRTYQSASVDILYIPYCAIMEWLTL